MAGILGIRSKGNVSRKMFYGLNSLQHRGQEGCGFAINTGDKLVTHRGSGLVMDAVSEDIVNRISGTIGIGNVRYAMATHSVNADGEPFCGYSKGEQLAIVNDGALINTYLLRTRLEQDGMMFQSNSDTEVILYLIARYYEGDIIRAIQKATSYLKGAYSFVLLFQDKLIAVRDPNGFRPLLMGSKDGEYFFASENAAGDILGMEFERDVEPGEIVVCSEGGFTSYELGQNAKHSFCIFEHVYLARNDANLEDVNAYLFRFRSGKILYQEAPLNVDLVVPVPDSGYPAAIGYSQASGIPLGEGLVKNRYMGRTFIKPTQEERDIAVRLKLNPQYHVVKDKKIVLVDDSIVRGTTSKNLIKNLRDAGAKEVHMLLTSPPVEYPCYFGIDTPSRKHLIAANHTVEEMREQIGADSLAFISLEGLYKASNRTNSNIFCDACFTGQYEVDPCVL
ncbi:MAG: amidophosphoribosyltransferase [Filifactor alocis]|nr:amidophosphoribosyltransferase [Filifactor alocis]